MTGPYTYQGDRGGEGRYTVTSESTVIFVGGPLQGVLSEGSSIFYLERARSMLIFLDIGKDRESWFCERDK